MKIVEKSITFEQEPDCCDGTSDYAQHLTVQTQDGGGGPFLILSTTRWAIDKDDLISGKFAAQLLTILEGMEE
jgi:hypothetical protein